MPDSDYNCTITFNDLPEDFRTPALDLVALLQNHQIYSIWLYGSAKVEPGQVEASILFLGPGEEDIDDVLKTACDRATAQLREKGWEDVSVSYSDLETIEPDGGEREDYD